MHPFETEARNNFALEFWKWCVKPKATGRVQTQKAFCFLPVSAPFPGTHLFSAVSDVCTDFSWLSELHFSDCTSSLKTRGLREKQQTYSAAGGIKVTKRWIYWRFPNWLPVWGCYQRHGDAATQTSFKMWLVKCLKANLGDGFDVIASEFLGDRILCLKSAMCDNCLLFCTAETRIQFVFADREALLPRDTVWKRNLR